MASTNTNKQPLLVDRPLFDSVRVTTQTVGSASTNTLFVQGGQAPSILVDMDAALQEDNNSGGVVDSITIVRNDYYRNPDYTLETATTGTRVRLVSGQSVYITATGLNTPAAESGLGYYTYTGAAAITGTLGTIRYSGVATPDASGFSYAGTVGPYQPEVTFVVYHTRGTTQPIPASGDYKVVLAKRVPANTQQVDCADVMPQLAAPNPAAGNASGLASGAPLRNRGIYLERGDRLYVGVFPDGPNASGYIPGAHVYAEGGFF